MKVVLLGATGMVGQGVLRECLLDGDIDAVVSIGRRATGVTHPKLTEHLHANLTEELLDPASIEPEIAGAAALFFCLGVPSSGMSEPDYRRVTHDLTLAVATAMANANPGSTFVYVSGQGADSTERGRVMWARVRGATENALLAIPDLTAFVLRPGFIQPRNGATSRVAVYRWLYRILGRPLFPVLRRVAPNSVSDTESIGRAMINLAGSGSTERILASRAINALAGNP